MAAPLRLTPLQWWVSLSFILAPWVSFFCGFCCGFIWFLWFWLWVYLISFVLASVLLSASISAIWSRSKKRSDGGLERMELNLGLRSICWWLRNPSSSLSFLINNGGSRFGYFVGMGLLTDRWVWWLVRWVWWLISGVDLWFGQWGGGGLIVLVSGGGFWVWLCFFGFVVIGFLIWVGLFTRFMGLICLEFGVDCVRIWRRTWRIRKTSCTMKNKLKNIKKCFLIVKF